ncbi:tetraspanin-2A-like isoform X1 [Penaeus japonicus]|uniref:tetraspanin-2A-like isoform X1 n=1 Tax=Penaeus japonicus TaxID=27405 RepID=UPI001C715C19|nr:tetraspanin-2A-like isoform X1 [Penaeus japonicus]
MALGKGKGKMEEHLELLQYLIYIFNTVFFCAGAAIFAIGLWIRFDEYMMDYVNGLGMYHYWIGTTTVMAGSAFVMITAFLGCCGAFFRSVPMVLTYKVMTVLTFGLLLGGSAYVLDNGLEDSRIYPWLQEAIRNKIYQYQWDVSARRTVDILQEYVGCCGGYSAGDYGEIHLPVPDTCRDQVTGNQYGDSCAEIFSQYLEVRTGWITGLSLSLCFFQCFAMMFAFCMWQALKEIQKGQ